MADAYLYVIGEENGPHKIGFSGDPLRRFHELQCGNPRTLYLRGTKLIDAGSAEAIEAWAHQFMADRWIRGEWFAVTAEEAWKHLHGAEMAVLCGRPAPKKLHRGGL